MQKIIVASVNPVKIQATEMGFRQMFPKEKFTLFGIPADSGVSGQPMSEEETLQGALNRVNAASNLVTDAEYWVGLEGGVKETRDGTQAFAWVVVRAKNGMQGKGRTGSFFLPKKVADLIRHGKELGEADDIVFKRHNSKQSNGAVGILTGDVLPRATYYSLAVILALIPFKNPSLY